MSDHISFCTLASGSSGNAVYAASSAGAVLIDAGISLKRLRENMSVRGLVGDNVDGIIVTHCHTDHIRGVGCISRGLQKPSTVPVFMTPGTRRACPSTLGKFPLREFAPGSRLSLGGFDIESLPTPHDAPESVALVLTRGRTRLGVFTDIGHLFDAFVQTLPTLDALVLESNYDPQMLAETTRYPESTKARIRGKTGHLSNDDAAKLLEEHAAPRLRAVLLAHLSENSNTPAKAMSSHRKMAAGFIGRNRPLFHIAPRHQPSEIIVVHPHK